VKVLLDTHIFLWAVSDDKRLTVAMRKTWVAPGNELFMSVASIWEILIKVGLHKLPLPVPAAAFIQKEMEQNRISLLGIRPAHLAELERLPPLHRDPFDRMLVAQARVDGLRLLSADAHIMKRYGVPLA